MKNIYYLQHDASDTAWRDWLPEEELEKLLNTSPDLDVITRDMFKLRIEQGWSVEY